MTFNKDGVLYNPYARTNKKSQDWLRFWQSLDVDLQVLEESNPLAKITDHFFTEKHDLIFISGGDGTVQNLQTEFGNRRTKSDFPALCLLPHGTTNMTATDVGFKAPRKSKIEAIISRKDYLKRATALQERGTIKVENVKNMRPQFGVFFGAGALYEVVRKFHENKDSQQLTGHLATGKILITEITSALLKKGTVDQKIYHGYEMQASIDGQAVIEGEQLFLLIATLDKLILGSEPFWNNGAGGLKITSAVWPLKRNLLMAVYDIMFARNHSNLREPEFISRTCDKLKLLIKSGKFTMDGEIFETEENKPLKISCGPKFTYLCG